MQAGEDSFRDTPAVWEWQWSRAGGRFLASSGTRSRSKFWLAWRRYLWFFLLLFKPPKNAYIPRGRKLTRPHNISLWKQIRHVKQNKYAYVCHNLEAHLSFMPVPQYICFRYNDKIFYTRLKLNLHSLFWTKDCI